MGSDSLYAALAEALSRPSKAYRATKLALDVPEQALQGYLGGTEIADKINQRKLAQQTLADMLGGVQNVPDRAKPYSGIRGSVLEKLGGFKGLADITEPIKTTERNDTLENILSEKVRSGVMSLEQASAIKRSMSPGVYQKPPPGFSFGSDGNLVPIPGGDPALKRSEEEAKKRAAIQEQLDKSKLVIRKIDEALSGAGPSTTGVMGALTKNIPGTPAKNLDETLNTVRANVGFDTLQAMRQSSPTGGALGQISDRENTLLQSVRGSLDQKQSLEQLQRNLQSLRDHFSNVNLAIENQTGDPDADNAIAQVIGSEDATSKKVALIRAIRARAGR